MTMKVVSASEDDITNFRFADDIVVNAEEEEEVQGTKWRSAHTRQK